jgi:hypothetical protein
MRRLRRAAVVVAAMVLAAAARADLAAIRSEPNPEKRARGALDYAERTLHAAEDAYREAQWEKTAAALGEVREAVVLAYDSLKATGKRPRRSPGPFKKAEIKTRKLQRHLEDFLLKMSVEEREQFEPVRETIQKVHDDLLTGVLAGWEKKK